MIEATRDSIDEAPQGVLRIPPSIAIPFITISYTCYFRVDIDKGITELTLRTISVPIT